MNCNYVSCISGTEKGNVMAGYYTLANKFVAVSANMLSKTLRKRIVQFSQYDAILDRYLISMPLIAQLGRKLKLWGQRLSLVILFCRN